MRFGKPLAAALLAAAALHGELQHWIADLAEGPRLRALLRGDMRRPPAETRAALTAMIQAQPADAELRRLRAHEAELALDFPAAEADWRDYARLSGGYLDLADYFHRRVEARKEVEALELAARQPVVNPYAPVERQRPWIAYQRIVAVTKESALPQSAATAAVRAWVTRYSGTPEAYQLAIDSFRDQQQWTDADAQLAAYRRAFPSDEVYPARTAAELQRARFGAAAAIRSYDTAFAPLWPRELTEAYFQLLEREGRLREFPGRARAALAANPTDLNATARLFHYFAHQGNSAAQRRVLLEYRVAKESRKQAWTPAELTTAARLFERVPDVNEAARLYYALYNLPGSTEPALAALAGLMLKSPGSGIRFGSGDLSFYRDIGTLDASPGFLNGILSLILNSTSPRWNYQEQNRKATAYFQRSRASELVALLERRFPQSRHRAGLRAQLIEAYAAYRDDEAVIAQGRAWMINFPDALQRVDVALTLADSYARLNQPAAELALYDQLLRELAAKANGVPVGEPSSGEQQQQFRPMRFRSILDEEPETSNARSPGYTRILDRYLSRLSALNRPMDALAVYRREIDRNPSDPGLYQRLAAYVEQNNLARDTEATYRRAMARFPERTWHHALARWYLKQQRASDFARLTREITDRFSGAELGTYFKDIVAGAELDARVYLEVNRYAHQRFPENLAFVRNLLTAYSRDGTRNQTAYDALLRSYWYYDADLKRQYLERLSVDGRLARELAAARPTDPAAQQFLAAGNAWLSHFEAAAPVMKQLADAYPGDTQFTGAASSIHRSLGDTQTAAALAERQWRAAPRDLEALAKAGEIFADREQFTQARTYWDRIPQVTPGNPAGYLSAATVFWDYFQFDDALRVITDARRRFTDPALFAYEAGAIHEGRRDFDRALAEYVKATDPQSGNRLTTLATRARYREAVERATTTAPLWVRASVLEAQQRWPELERLLSTAAANTTDSPELTRIAETASRLGLTALETRTLERQAAVNTDPLERIRLRIALGKLHESRNDLVTAERLLTELRRDNPLVLGVIRADVDFRIRTRQTAPATAILLEAARAARKDLAASFTLEAARIETGAARYDRARELLASLLADDPQRAEYLAAMAGTYAAAGDDAGFRTYQLGAIQSVKDTATIVSMRRALIPVLERLQDYPAAVDQYIECINKYPEDEQLLRTAARFALVHGRVPQLRDFYRRTIEQAPRDYRWPIVLARLETVAEDYPAAIRAYDAAMKARPDRADVVERRAALEERLLRFNEASVTYRRLYDLTYRDPQWMIKVAEMRARLNDRKGAVEALQTAVIGARAETSGALFDIARRLDGWNMVAEAMEFAERGAAMAGKDFWSFGEGSTYGRLLARTRQMPKAFSVIPENSGAMNEAAHVVADEYSPAEKAALRPLIEARPGNAYTQFAAEARLYEVETQRRFQAMLQSRKMDSRLASLQVERGVYGEWARQLEQFGDPNSQAQAMQAYLHEGDETNAARMATLLIARNSLSGPLLEWYLATLSLRDRGQLLALVRSAPTTTEIRNRAVQFAITNGDAAFAREAVQARGYKPVWTRLYTALTGTYFLDPAPAIAEAYRSGLGDSTIGQRVSTKVNHDEQLAGRLWFYYGARYGEYLDALHRPGADDYLPASIEGAADSAYDYLDFGDYWAGQASADKAIERYRQAAELDPDLGAAHNRIAALHWRAGRRDEALVAWRQALGVFLAIQSRGVRVPEFYWTQLTETITSIGELKAMRELQPDLERLLAGYVHINGGYRLNALLEAAYRASLQSGQSPNWVIRIADGAREGSSVLAALEGVEGLTDAQRIDIARERMLIGEREAAAATGWNRQWAIQTLDRQRANLAGRLMAAGDFSGAESVVNAMTAGRATLDIRLAARRGTLAALLDRYRNDPPNAPDAQVLRQAAMILKPTDSKSAQQVLEYLYTREIDAMNLDASNFLGLAEALLARGDTSGAVTALRRMTLVAGEPFELYLPAADVLTRFGRTQEAAEFIADRKRAVPWETLPPPPGPETRNLAQLREALAAAPHDRVLRLSTVSAALAAKQDRLAFALATYLGEEQRRTIAEALGQAAERLGDRNIALRYYANAGLTQKFDALRAELDLLQDNAARQPVIRAGLEQQGVVRPRLNRRPQ